MATPLAEVHIEPGPHGAGVALHGSIKLKIWFYKISLKNRQKNELN